MRAVQLGDTVVDHFPVFGPDGTTKVSGASGLTATFWQDGAVVAISYAIAEIAAGEYRITFTPTAPGVIGVEVVIPSNGDRWGADYDVTKPDLRLTFAAADDNTDATFAVWGEVNGERVAFLDSIAAVLRAPDGTEVVDLGTDASPTADGVFEFVTPSAGIAGGNEYYLDVCATWGAITWYSNLGLSKV